MASNQWIYNQFGIGPNNSKMPTKAEIQNYGLFVPDSYTSTQLVKEEDIVAGVKEIPIYVIIKQQNFPDSVRVILERGEEKYAQYFNLFNNYWDELNGTNKSLITMMDGSTYPLVLDTRRNLQNNFTYHNFDSSYGTLEYDMSLITIKTSTSIPYGKIIQGIHIEDLRLEVYDKNYNTIGSSGAAVTTDFMYHLTLQYKRNNIWYTPSVVTWTSHWGGLMVGAMVGFSERNILDTSNSFVSTSLNSADLQGIAVSISFSAFTGVEE